MHKSLISLSIISTLFFAMGCGSEQSAVESRILNRPVNPTPTIVTSLDSVTLNVSDIRYLEKNTSVVLKISGGYDAECIDGSTSITWKVVGDSSKVAFEKADICMPTLTTSNTYSGDISIKAELQTSARKIIYQSTLKRGDQDPEVCALNNGEIIDDQCVYSVCKTNTECMRNARELDGRNAERSVTNATAVCAGAGFSKFYDHTVTAKSISCGYNYGLTNWNGTAFVNGEYPICRSGTVSIITQIRCVK